MAKQSSSGEPLGQELYVPGSIRRERQEVAERRQEAAERREKALRVLLVVSVVVFVFFTVIAALLGLLRPQCTPLQNVPGSSVYLFACYPRALGAGEEGQVKVTVVNDGPGELADVKVFLVCPRELQVGVEINGSNMIQFDDVGDKVRKTGQVNLSPEIFLSGEKVEFSLRVIGIDVAQAGSVIDDTLEGGTFPLLPFPVNKVLKAFWPSVSASMVSGFSALGVYIRKRLAKRETS